ncbi:hypothetical protein HDU81_009403 [Chytriomyces hyalinus]|nr:hypothetical protein HDU81_009403 [Chytriomyces hyalinus]
MLQQFEYELSTGLGESALQLKEMIDSIELVSHVQANVILNLTRFEAHFDRTIAVLTGSLETLSELSTEAIEKHASVISLFMPYVELLNIALNVTGYAISFLSKKAFQFCMGSIAFLSNFQPLKQHRLFLLFSTALSTTIAASEIINSDSQAKVGFSTFMILLTARGLQLIFSWMISGQESGTSYSKAYDHGKPRLMRHQHVKKTASMPSIRFHSAPRFASIDD